MIVIVQNETPFQVLSNSFTIGPSSSGYELQVGATSRDFTTLFTVGADIPRMVTNVANGSYFRLKNNVGEVEVNWSRTCKDSGGGSGSGVTPEEVQAQIDSALTPYWDSAVTKDYVDEAISGVSIDLSDYYTSAQTESAITLAVSGKADAANIEANTSKFYFPKWNDQGVVNGYVNGEMKLKPLFLNGDNNVIVGQNNFPINIYAPESVGTAGEMIVSTGNGAPVWSAVTFISSADVETQINGVLTAYTPTTNIATVNGSALTNGGNIVIEGGADMSNYYTKSEVNSAFTPVADFNELSGIVQEQQIVFSSGYNELHTQVLELSARTTDLSAYYTSAQTQQAIITAFNSATTHIEDVEEVMSTALNAFQDEIDSLSGGGDSTILSPREEFPLDAETGSVVAKVKPNIILEWTTPTLNDNYYLGKLDLNGLDTATTYNLGSFDFLDEGVVAKAYLTLVYFVAVEYGIEDWQLWITREEVVDPDSQRDFLTVFSIRNDTLDNWRFYYQDAAANDPDGFFEWIGGDYTEDGIGELWLYISDENGDDYTIQSGFEPELEGIDGGLVADGVYQFNGEDWKQIGESESGSPSDVLEPSEAFSEDDQFGSVRSVPSKDYKWVSKIPNLYWDYVYYVGGEVSDTHYPVSAATTIGRRENEDDDYWWTFRADNLSNLDLTPVCGWTEFGVVTIQDEDYGVDWGMWLRIFNVTEEEAEIPGVPMSAAGLWVRAVFYDENSGEEDTAYWFVGDGGTIELNHDEEIDGETFSLGIYGEYVDYDDYIYIDVNRGGPFGHDTTVLNVNTYDTYPESMHTLYEGIKDNRLYMKVHYFDGEEESYDEKLIPTLDDVDERIAGVISAATQDMVTSTSVSTIWKGTEAEYDEIDNPDESTLYIIIE